VHRHRQTERTNPVSTITMPTSSTAIGTAGRRHPLRRAAVTSGVVAAVSIAAIVVPSLARQVRSTPDRTSTL
jgi:hypothetical protein